MFDILDIFSSTQSLKLIFEFFDFFESLGRESRNPSQKMKDKQRKSRIVKKK